MFQVIRKSNVGDYGDPVIWESVLEEFDTKESANAFIKEQLVSKPYLKYDRLYVKEVKYE